MNFKLLANRGHPNGPKPMKTNSSINVFYIYYRNVAHVVIAVLRIQGSAENWKKMVAKVSSKSVTPVSE